MAARSLFTRPLLDAHLRGLFEQRLEAAELIEWNLAGGDLICAYDRPLKPEMIAPGVERLRTLATLLAPPGL